MEKNILILLGAPGSGKGSQATKISQKLKIPHISTGNLLRAQIHEKTALGMKAKEYIDAGKLTPDSLVTDMLFERVNGSDCENGFILDGYPRTLSQADDLQSFLEDHLERVQVFYFEVADDLIVERITGRLICHRCGQPYHKVFTPPSKEGICDLCGGHLFQRTDDTEEVVRKRLKVYQTQTEPLINYYKEKQMLVTIDCSPDPKTIFDNIMKVIA